MQDEEESKPAEVQEVVNVVTTTKIITEVVSAASDTITASSTTIIAADVPIPAATTVSAPTLTAAPSKRRKGVVIRDPKESSTPSTIIHSEAKSKDKGKGILVEEPKPLKKQAQIEQDEKYARELEEELNKTIDWDEVIDHTEAQARKNMMIYLKNVVDFKMDYFKGMSYDDIRLIFEKYFDSNVAFLQKTKEHIDEEDSRALKRLNESQEEKAAKKQKLDEEVKELKRHLQIVPNDEDDATQKLPLLLARSLLLTMRFTMRTTNLTTKSKELTIVDFLNAQVIQYTLMVNPTIYVSCIKQLWATVSIKKANDVVKLRALIDGKRVVVTEDVIRQDLCLDDANGVECLPNEEIFTELARMGYEKPPPKLMFYKAFFFAHMVRNVDRPSKFLMYPWFLQVTINAQVDDLSSHANQYTSSALTQKVFANMRRIDKGFSRVETPLFAIMLVQPQPPAAEEEDEVKGKKDDVSAGATKEASVVEPTMFDDEEVAMTMAQTLIKMKSKKARLLNEHMAKRLHDEEVKQAAIGEKQEKYDLEKAKVLQQQYVDKQENIDWNVAVEQMQEKHLDNIRKYQSLNRKPISIAQARKNIIVYLKNMVGYKMEHFRGMTYDKVRPIFEREYNKVQTLFKPDKDVEEPQKKRVAEETLLHESFKKLKAVEVSVSHSTQDTPTHDPKEMSEEDVKNMLEIVLVSEFKVEALQVKYPLIDWEIHSEGSRSYWKIIRVGGITEAYQSFEDMLKGFDKEDLDALWRLVKENAKLQVEEDSYTARDPVMKIFMEANKPKSKISVSNIVGLDLSKLAIILNRLKKIHSKGLTRDMFRQHTRKKVKTFTDKDEKKKYFNHIQVRASKAMQNSTSMAEEGGDSNDIRLLDEILDQIDQTLSVVFTNYKYMDENSPSGMMDVFRPTTGVPPPVLEHVVELYKLTHHILSSEAKNKLCSYFQVVVKKRSRQHLTETNEYISGNGEGILMHHTALSMAYQNMKSSCPNIRNEIFTDIEIHNCHILPMPLGGEWVGQDWSVG
nr:hypothetical protein CTI12_AA624380 [Tanacetum cinerariifolium]